ncbi:MAG: hypothetical protein BWK79_02310 [Beggiatoa sp. IS2]|nr:MAG: hypothetical protein BWK79_02310 [Beggiatoa sp. IS2]
MQIVADENIPYVREAFSTLGHVRTVNGRTLGRTDLDKTDILLVRSVTPVTPSLLKGTAVRFVGTATIGFDHIDLDYLRQHDIGFANAPGSNAESTAEYVISALLITATQQHFQLKDKVVGIIGCGNVGSKVFQKLQALGVACLRYDPPLRDKTSVTHYVDLKDIFTADILTLHVPLEKEGRYPTYQMINADFLEKLREDVILINTSRGKIMVEPVLLAHLATHPKMNVILDVWDNEPHINHSLLQRALLGTPHIAGYSLDGKARGTEMLYQAACAQLHCPVTWQASDFLPPAPITALSFSNSIDEAKAIFLAVITCYDVRQDDATLRLIHSTTTPSEFFDQLRKNYSVRREFSSLNIEIPQQHATIARQLRGLGFEITPTTSHSTL